MRPVAYPPGLAGRPPARPPPNGAACSDLPTPTGEGYSSSAPELVDDRIACRKLLKLVNQTLEYDDVTGREAALRQLVQCSDWSSPPWIEPPFFCDYG